MCARIPTLQYIQFVMIVHFQNPLLWLALLMPELCQKVLLSESLAWFDNPSQSPMGYLGQPVDPL